MPATSQSQRRLIFGKRNQYKSEKNTPKNWKWIWSEDYENKGKLPEKVKKESLICKFNTFVNEKYDNEKKVDDMSPSELKDEDIKYKEKQNRYKLTPHDERRWKKISKKLNEE